MSNAPWYVLDESPGAVGDPEVWIDAAILDPHVRDRANPPVAVEVDDGNVMAGVTIRFSTKREPAYKIGGLRYSSHNYGRPYYVARRPD
jgi:hypothetical protein